MVRRQNGTSMCTGRAGTIKEKIGKIKNKCTQMRSTKQEKMKTKRMALKNL
jgi:hypothetical protein